MNDELERLRDVARAAAAYLKADDESLASLRPFSDGPRQPPTEASVQEARRLSRAAHDRRTELVQALARLAELNPPT